MAKRAKIDNSVKKRLARQERKRKQAIRSIRQYVLIVCEGEKTEPNYFEGFKADLPRGVLDNNRIEIEGEGKNTLSLIDEVIKLRNRREREVGRTFDQTWAVFDKDDFPATNFNNAIFKAAATQPLIQCAWTNEAFELWYCLHFCFIQHAMPRQDYAQRISEELTNRLGKPFTYQKNDPGMYALLKAHGDRQQARAWAIRLEELHGDAQNYADQNPCTKMHHLVKALEALQ
jgi:hypothetical protein